MDYPRASAEQIGFFHEHGYLVVPGAVPQADLDTLESYCDLLLQDKERLANDWKSIPSPASGRGCRRRVRENRSRSTSVF